MFERRAAIGAPDGWSSRTSRRLRLPKLTARRILDEQRYRGGGNRCHAGDLEG